MTAYVKDAGVWKPSKDINVKDAGVWKPLSQGYIRDAGVWKPFHAAGGIETIYPELAYSTTGVTNCPVWYDGDNLLGYNGSNFTSSSSGIQNYRLGATDIPVNATILAVRFFAEWRDARSNTTTNGWGRISLFDDGVPPPTCDFSHDSLLLNINTSGPTASPAWASFETNAANNWDSVLAEDLRSKLNANVDDPSDWNNQNFMISLDSRSLNWRFYRFKVEIEWG